jgi:4-hydroxyphenylacetate 3-hydroxylase, reductase component
MTKKPFDKRAYRTALGAFATGVTVITTRGPIGEPIGNTVNSFSSVSLDPPLILWSLGKTAYSFKAYLAAERFAVNVLREGQEDISHRFSRSLVDKWDGLEFEEGRTGCPIIPDALAVFECKTEYIYQGGDHVIFVGEVLHYDHDPKGKPLIFWAGSYGKAHV